MKNGFSFSEKSSFGRGVGANLTALIGDEARVAELSVFGSELIGMFLANLTGSSFSWVVNTVMGKLGMTESKWLNSNFITAILGGVTMWKLPDILRLIGLNEVAGSFDSRDTTLGNIRKGATLLFGLSAGIQGLGFAGKQLNIAIPGFSSGSVLDSIKSTLSGVGLLDVWSASDYSAKASEFEKSIEDLKNKLKDLGMPSSGPQKELYLYCIKLLGYATQNIISAKQFMDSNDLSSVDNLLEQAKEDIDITSGAIVGLSAAPAPAVETAAPVVPVAPTTVTPAQQTVIENPDTGAKIQVPAPAVTETVVAEETAPGEPKTAGKAFFLDTVLPWSQYVAKQTGWTPTQVALGFVLKYLANNGHIWAYGPDPVVAYKNYAAYSGVAGVNGTNSPAFAVATVGGVRKTFKVRSKDGMRSLLQSILGR